MCSVSIVETLLLYLIVSFVVIYIFMRSTIFLWLVAFSLNNHDILLWFPRFGRFNPLIRHFYKSSCVLSLRRKKLRASVYPESNYMSLSAVEMLAHRSTSSFSSNSRPAVLNRYFTERENILSPVSWKNQYKSSHHRSYFHYRGLSWYSYA